MLIKWRERVIKAQERQKQGKKPFLAGVIYLAGDFGTCAVWEAHTEAPFVVTMRAWGGPAPQDQDLYGLGIAFSDAVERQDPARASVILDQIEDRALQLKRSAH